MTRGIIIASAGIGVALLAGCSAQPSMPVSRAPVVVAEEVEAEPAAALIFQSPIAAASRPVDLSRAAREPSAFVGFDGPITTFLYQETDDRQSNQGGDFYDRRSLVYRLGSSTR